MNQRIKSLVLVAIAMLLPQPAWVAEHPLHPSAARVARRIEAKRDWVTEAALCPTVVAPTRTAIVESGKNDCAGPPYDPCMTNCEKGDGPSCYWLAYELETHGADEKTVEPLFQRACKLGIVSGCTNRAAGMLKDTIEESDAAIQKCAARTFEITCGYDDPWGCEMYALLLSHGLGIEKNDALALKVLEKSCKYGDSDPACRAAKALRASIEKKKR